MRSRLVALMLPLDPLFKAYDVRGSVPDQLDAEVCRAVGSAFARSTRAPRVGVARAMRESGRPLSGASIDGAASGGATLTGLGLASTDLLYLASGSLGG